jgi:hypothetical protein
MLMKLRRSRAEAHLRLVFPIWQRVEGFPPQESIGRRRPKNLPRLRDHFSRSDNLPGLSPFEVRVHPVEDGPFGYWHGDPLIIPDQFAAIAAFEYAKHAVGSGVQKRLQQPRRQFAVRTSEIWCG